MIDKRIIEIKEADLYFNKCVCCGTDTRTKKVVIGNSCREESFVLCENCRIELYTHVIPRQKIDAVEKLNYIFENTI